MRDIKFNFLKGLQCWCAPGPSGPTHKKYTPSGSSSLWTVQNQNVGGDVVDLHDEASSAIFATSGSTQDVDCTRAESFQLTGTPEWRDNGVGLSGRQQAATHIFRTRVPLFHVAILRMAPMAPVLQGFYCGSNFRVWPRWPRSDKGFLLRVQF
eukprot:scaffold16550_cov115-Isochrysis_galbana.AAC.2